MARTAGSATRLTYDDLVAMFPAEDGLRRELVDGSYLWRCRESKPTRRHGQGHRSVGVARLSRASGQLSTT